MLAVLLCIAAVYACAVVYARLVARHRVGSPSRHYVLVAGNHEAQIEWYMRAMQSYSRRSGTDIRVSIIPEGSADETEAIVRTFAREDSGIEWLEAGDDELAGTGGARELRGFGWRRGEEMTDAMQAVRIDLSKPEDVKRLPL